MRTPDSALAWARQRYTNQKRRWFEGGGEWPLSLSLDRPSEQEALRAPVKVREWSEAWARWSPSSPDVVVSTETVKWARLGMQTLPNRISFASPAAVARHIGEASSWQRATGRRDKLVAQWPVLAQAGTGTHFEVLAGWAEEDFLRLIALLRWFDANPRSGLYLRQIPVQGIDTKWVDLQRRGVVSDFLRRLRWQAGTPSPDEPSPEQDFFERCGLLRPTPTLRILLLSPELRHAAGGLRDIQAPLEQLQRLDLAPRRALVVENLETAYCLPDYAGTVAFVKLGNAVSLASQMPWMRGVPVVYWGDIDTYGFSILAQARKTLGNVTSTLMDEATLKAFIDRCILEPVQTCNADRAWLSADEADVYKGLVEGTWGRSLRLEQERIDWTYCRQRLNEALA